MKGPDKMVMKIATVAWLLVKCGHVLLLLAWDCMLCDCLGF